MPNIGQEAIKYRDQRDFLHRALTVATIYIIELETEHVLKGDMKKEYSDKAKRLYLAVQQIEKELKTELFGKKTIQS